MVGHETGYKTQCLFIRKLYLYTMLNILITGLFLISAAIAAGGIIVASKLRDKFRFDSLLYMQVFCYIFGFYALWGQVFTISYISPYIEKPVLDKITEILLLLGAPFIVFGWLMFLKFVHEFTGRSAWKYFNSVYLVVNILFLTAVAIFTSGSATLKTMDVLKYYFILSNFLYVFFAAVVILTPQGKQQFRSFKKSKDLVTGMVLFMLAQNVSLFFYPTDISLAFVFVFLFFAGSSFIPVFLRYNLAEKEKMAELPATFEDFCRHYEISPREKEIIREICNGLSNQQIADKLFISLQTVKDHTHRIYGKTLATSRMQLMKMVQEVSAKMRT